MEHLKETKTDNSAVTASSSSTSSSCSSSSSASSSSSSPPVDHDSSTELPLQSPAVPSPTASLSSSSTDSDPEHPKLLDSAASSFSFNSASSPSADADAAQSMEVDRVDGSSSDEDGKEPATPAQPSEMESDQLSSSLSSSTLTSPSSTPSNPSTTSVPSTDSSSSSSSSDSSSSSSATPDASLTLAPVSSPSSSSSSPSPSAASPTTASLSTVSLDPEEQQIQSFLKSMHSDVKKGEASVRSILKMLQSLQRAPTKTENRRMRRDNIVVKKAVMDVPGAVGLMALVGYKEVELNKHPYLAIDDREGVHAAYLDKAVRLLLQYAERQAEEEKKPASVTTGTRVRCAGGCGYWGDPAQENLCSICHKTKYMGAAAVKAMTGIAAPEAKKCIKGCGMYGADKFGGMCSQCHSKEKASSASAPPAPKTRLQRLASVRRKLHAVWVLGLGKQVEQVNKSRCFICSKRLPVPIECRCRRTFCSQHRFPLDHQCSYDAQSEQKKKLRRNLIQTQTSKMDKI